VNRVLADALAVTRPKVAEDERGEDREPAEHHERTVEAVDRVSRASETSSSTTTPRSTSGA